jgi:hypothetical protein
MIFRAQQIIFCAIALVLTTQSVSVVAANLDTISRNVSLGFALQDFGYKEFDDQDTLLDREDGWISGISGTLSTQTEKYSLDIGISYLNGNVVYDGQLQNGTPHKTKTNEQIFDASISLGFFDVIKNLPKPSVLYFGLGFREWQRDILPTSTVLGLFEIYSWHYGFIGGKIELFDEDKFTVWLDGRLTRPINPTMNICLSGYDCADLDLGVNTSGRVSVPIHYQLYPNNKLIFEPYFESWDFGRSPNETLTINGTPTGIIIYEPQSETRNIGINISVNSQF